MIILYAFLFKKKRVLHFFFLGFIVTGIYGLMHLMITELGYSTFFDVPIAKLTLPERLWQIPKIFV